MKWQSPFATIVITTGSGKNYRDVKTYGWKFETTIYKLSKYPSTNCLNQVIKVNITNIGGKSKSAFSEITHGEDILPFCGIPDKMHYPNQIIRHFTK